MTRTTTLATLLAAALGLSACMSNDAGMSTETSATTDSSLATGVSNPDEADTQTDAISSPTDGIEDGPDL